MEGAWLPLTTATPLFNVVCTTAGAWITARLPLSRAGCSTDCACLPLTTTPSISDKAGRDDSAWIPPSTTALLASGVCDASGAWVSVSAAVLVIGTDCRDDDSRAAPSAVTPTDSAGEPALTIAGITAVDEFAPSQANNAAPQMPTVANTLTATAAVRNLLARLGRLRAARRGLDAAKSAFTA